MMFCREFNERKMYPMNKQDHPSRAVETHNQVADADLFGNPVPSPSPESPQILTVLGDLRDISPFDCVVWAGNPRQLDRLTEENTQELRDSILSSGQQIPVIARLTSGGTARYEIVAGARRFWSINWLAEHGHPDIQLRLDIRSMDDEAAFRFASLENNDRTSMSHYETAISLKQALGSYYGGRQVLLAKALGRSEAWVSRHLALAEIPIEVANCYPEFGDIPLKHGPEIVGLLGRDTEKLFAAAESLNELQAGRLSGGKGKLLAGECLNYLLRSFDSEEGKRKPKAALPTLGPKQAPHAEVLKVKNGKMDLRVNLASKVKAEQVGSFVQKWFEKNRVK